MSDVIEPSPSVGMNIDANGTTYHLGDGLTVRVRKDGTVRIRSYNHKLALDWLTNKPGAGDTSIVSLRLTRKDVEPEAAAPTDELKATLRLHVRDENIRLRHGEWQRGIYEPWRPVEDQDWNNALDQMLHDDEIEVRNYDGLAILATGKEN